MRLSDKTRSKTGFITLCAVLTACALTLSFIERLLPLQMLIPIPGIKLGLANIVTIAALYMMDFKSAFTVVVLRCILSAFFGGGITGLAFSLTGGILSAALMALLIRSVIFSVYGVSIAGSAAHVTGQIAAAFFIMDSVYVFAYLPILLLSSVFMGTVTGCAAAAFLKTTKSGDIFSLKG